MLEVLIIVLLGAHLVLVDIAMAGPLGCIWLERLHTRHDDGAADRVGLALARVTLWALLGGMFSGVTLVGIYWQRGDSDFFTAAQRVPASRLWFAGVELCFSLACMAAYWWLWQRWRHHRYLHRALAIAAASNLMIHFPTLFAIISILGTRADGLDQVLDRSGYQRWLVDPEVMARVAHVWLAAFSVAAATAMGLASRAREASSEPLIRGGAQAALLATCLQLPVGMWLTVQMSESSREPLVGGDGIATTLFLISLGLAMWLVQMLSAVAQGDCSARLVRRAIVAMLLVVMLMTATLARAKDCGKTVSMHAAQGVARGGPRVRAADPDPSLGAFTPSTR
jgi:hypothetical protein